MESLEHERNRYHDGQIMSRPQQSQKTVTDSVPATANDPPKLEDRSYLAYLRSTPRPFLHFASGHIPSATRTQPHDHPCIALHGCLQGSLTLCTQAGELPLEAGVFYLIAPRCRHYWRNDSRVAGATVGLLLDTGQPGRWPLGSGVESCCRELQSRVSGLHRFKTSGDQELHQSFWLAADHLTAERPREQLSLTGVLLALFGQIKERLCDDSTTVRADPDTAQRIRHLLLARVRDRLTIPQIAREIGTSSTSAKEVFREAFGCGIMAYFNQLKIWQAKRLLNDLSLTVEQVSRQLGFSSPSYFSRAFVKQAGETPSAYRQRNAEIE